MNTSSKLHYGDFFVNSSRRTRQEEDNNIYTTEIAEDIEKEIKEINFIDEASLNGNKILLTSGIRLLNDKLIDSAWLVQKIIFQWSCFQQYEMPNFVIIKYMNSGHSKTELEFLNGLTRTPDSLRNPILYKYPRLRINKAATPLSFCMVHRRMNKWMLMLSFEYDLMCSMIANEPLNIHEKVGYISTFSWSSKRFSNSE